MAACKLRPNYRRHHADDRWCVCLRCFALFAARIEYLGYGDVTPSTWPGKIVGAGEADAPKFAFAVGI